MRLGPDPELLDAAGQAAGICLDEHSVEPVAGGDISGAYRCRDARGRSWFMKINRAVFIDAFAAEQAGLQALAASDAVRVPQARASGVTSQRAWLLLEWLDLQPGGAASAAALGTALATMHRTTGEQFGWRRDNYIGATPQLNEPAADWTTFYAERRLRPQLELAADNGAPDKLLRKGQRLVERLPALLAGHQPVPSLLHGDLWSGNWAALADGEPVIFDPACYHGDREADLAMTRLFGGFPAEFYAAYEAAWPLPDGHQLRLPLYQLYHVLNHYNLFGGAYLAQAARMLDTLLAAH